ncbi:MAG: aminopeptidase [Candidatus Binatota bacterium]|nr:aminopeptidase [Candidatus Binatota bacterium]
MLAPYKLLPVSILLALTLVLSALLSACSPVYVIRAAYEEGKILWRRQPIAEYIQKPDVTAETQEKLKTVLAVRDYARDVLKLNVGGSYASYSYVDRPDLTYVVVAAPKTELRPYTWWFLIVGNVPYKGYFSRPDAEAEIERLKADGYDTTLRTSAAFSTLGWFDDPLLSHLLKYDKVGLAEIVFHELFHNTLYLAGKSAFNESAANFIGHRAAVDFFRAKFGADSVEHKRALQWWTEEREFGAFVAEVVRDLTVLYKSDLSRQDKLRLREEVFIRSKAEWARRIADRPAHRFRGFSQQVLNNAVLMHYVVYLKDFDLFESLYESAGKDLPKTIKMLQRAAAKGGDPFEAVRQLAKKS